MFSLPWPPSVSWCIFWQSGNSYPLHQKSCVLKRELSCDESLSWHPSYQCHCCKFVCAAVHLLFHWQLVASEQFIQLSANMVHLTTNLRCWHEWFEEPENICLCLFLQHGVFAVGPWITMHILLHPYLGMYDPATWQAVTAIFTSSCTPTPPKIFAQ